MDARHPDYEKFKHKWELCRDSWEGEEVIKEKGAKYLPPTPGQVLDGMSLTGGVCSEKSIGYISYTNYKARAVFPDFFTEGVKTLVGILNEKDPDIALPPDMEFLRTDATFDHQPLTTLYREMQFEQLTTGRAGLFADMPKDAAAATTPRHYIEMYKAEKILNWDDGSFNDGFNKLNLVVLDECGVKRESNYSWVASKRFRVLSLGPLSENEPIGSYRFAEVESDAAGAQFVTPMFKGRQADEIPFVFVSATDLNPRVQEPPLIGLARICHTIYKGEADYRYTLYMQGQETLVVIGGLRAQNTENPEDRALRVGADARIDIEMGGDAKYIGVGASGIPEQRTALEADKQLAAVRTGQLLAPGKMSMESGEALKTRVAAQTATLTSIAKSSASALERILQMIAKWRGSDPAKVRVTPNLDFTNFQLAAQDLVQLMTAKGLGLPLAFATIHDVMRERGMTRNTFEDELAAIAKDPPALKKIMEDAQGNDNNPQAAAGGPRNSTQGARPQTNTPTK